MSSPPALELQGLTKSYGGKLTALSDVNLTIRPGEIFALLGPNGAGKTTLIGSVCGLVKKTSGKIFVFGHDLDEDPVRPRYEVGLVPQEINFDPFFTVAESLYIQQGYYGHERRRGAGDGGAHRAQPAEQGGLAHARAVGRHEAPAAHRQGAGAQAAARLPRRAHRRRGRGAAPGLVDLRAQAAPPRAPPSSSPRTTWRRPRSWPTAWASSTRAGC